jgi:hypothetical protein
MRMRRELQAVFGSIFDNRSHFFGGESAYWTHRKVWVTIAGDPAPVLFAEDVRTIAYWGD